MIQLLLAAGSMALMLSLVGYQVYKIRWLQHHGRQIVAMVTSIRHETGRQGGDFYGTIIMLRRHGRIRAQGEGIPSGHGL